MGLSTVYSNNYDLKPRLVLSPCRLLVAEGKRAMSPRLARHLRDAVPVIVFFVIVALTWDNVRWYLAPEDGPREPLTVMFLGVLLAAAIPGWLGWVPPGSSGEDGNDPETKPLVEKEDEEEEEEEKKEELEALRTTKHHP